MGHLPVVFACAAFVSLPFLASAEVRYSVQTVNDNTRLQVTIRFAAGPGPVELQMPNWAPGAYVLSYPGTKVESFAWLDASGNPVAFEHRGENSWRASLPQKGEAIVEYTVPMHLEGGALHYGGPATYMYVVGRKEEACRLDLQLPAGWKVATGLDAVGRSNTRYKAPTYDVLADNPVTAGDFIDYHYTSHGRPVTIALRGPLRGNVNEAKVLKMCKAITDTEGDFFHGVPYHKYVWHFGVTSAADGGGGLEHLSSTQISLAQGVGPLSARVCAHEFFHLWNVKRIRAKVLGPFDYTRLPKTGALYWLEGVTDYYASVLITRSGYLGRDALLKDIASNYARVETNPAHLEVSPYDSSLRVGEAAGGRGNSNGYQISYYNLGWLVGLCLDLDLRDRTQGRKSLDDVELALWQQCKANRPGFEEGDIERHYVEQGGSREFFRKVVMHPGELPVAEELMKIGYKLEMKPRTTVDFGFSLTAAAGATLASVTSVKPMATGLAADDQLLEINGVSVAGRTLDESLDKARVILLALTPGSGPLRLKIRHAGQDQEISYPLTEATAPYPFITDTNPTDKTILARREAWFRGK